MCSLIGTLYVDWKKQKVFNIVLGAEICLTYTATNKTDKKQMKI